MFAQAKTAAAALALAIGLSAAAAASAAPVSDPDTVTIKVSVSDLDLNSAAGAQAALYRIHNAASDICGGAPMNTDLAQGSYYKTCMRAVVDRAVGQIHTPMVSALNEGGKTPTQIASVRP